MIGCGFDPAEGLLVRSNCDPRTWALGSTQLERDRRLLNGGVPRFPIRENRPSGAYRFGSDTGSVCPPMESHGFRLAEKTAFGFWYRNPGWTSAVWPGSGMRARWRQL
jgi:hypothetical protein